MLNDGRDFKLRLEARTLERDLPLTFDIIDHGDHQRKADSVDKDDEFSFDDDESDDDFSFDDDEESDDDIYDRFDLGEGSDDE